MYYYGTISHVDSYTYENALLACKVVETPCHKGFATCLGGCKVARGCRSSRRRYSARMDVITLMSCWSVAAMVSASSPALRNDNTEVRSRSAN